MDWSGVDRGLQRDPLVGLKLSRLRVLSGPPTWTEKGRVGKGEYGYVGRWGMLRRPAGSHEIAPDLRTYEYFVPRTEYRVIASAYCKWPSTGNADGAAGTRRHASPWFRLPIPGMNRPTSCSRQDSGVAKVALSRWQHRCGVVWCGGGGMYQYFGCRYPSEIAPTVVARKEGCSPGSRGGTCCIWKRGSVPSSRRDPRQIPYPSGYSRVLVDD